LRKSWIVDLKTSARIGENERVYNNEI